MDLARVMQSHDYKAALKTVEVPKGGTRRNTDAVCNYLLSHDRMVVMTETLTQNEITQFIKCRRLDKKEQFTRSEKRTISSFKEIEYNI